MWECKICNVCFEEIPDNSELIREKQGISMYRIDGMIHIIRKKPTPKAKPGAFIQPKTSIVVQQKPEPIQPDAVAPPKPKWFPVEPEPELELTPMQYAWKKARRK